LAVYMQNIKKISAFLAYTFVNNS